MCFDLCALCNWVCCIKNKKKKKESKNRSQIKSGCFLFFCHYIVIFLMQTHGLHLWLRTEWVILPDYITYFQWAGQLGAVMGFVWVSSHTWRYSVFLRILSTLQMPCRIAVWSHWAVQKWLNWNLIFFHLSHYGQIESPAAVLWPGPQSRPLFRLQFDSF